MRKSQMSSVAVKEWLPATGTLVPSCPPTGIQMLENPHLEFSLHQLGGGTNEGDMWTVTHRHGLVKVPALP